MLNLSHRRRETDMLLRWLHHVVHYNHLGRLVLAGQVSLMMTIEVMVVLVERMVVVRVRQGAVVMMVMVVLGQVLVADRLQTKVGVHLVRVGEPKGRVVGCKLLSRVLQVLMLVLVLVLELVLLLVLMWVLMLEEVLHLLCRTGVCSRLRKVGLVMMKVVCLRLLLRLWLNLVLVRVRVLRVLKMRRIGQVIGRVV